MKTFTSLWWFYCSISNLKWKYWNTFILSGVRICNLGDKTELFCTIWNVFYYSCHKRKNVLIKNVFKIRKINKNLIFCVFYLISPSRSIFIQSEWSVSYFFVQTGMHSVQQVKMMKNVYFCWHKQKKCWRHHNHANFLMKIKNSYDSCYIYKISCPLHNFFLEKLAQANLPYPPPPYPPPGMRWWNISPPRIELTKEIVFKLQFSILGMLLLLIHDQFAKSWSIKKRVLKYFAKYTGKHLCQSPFFNKVADCEA